MAKTMSFQPGLFGSAGGWSGFGAAWQTVQVIAISYGGSTWTSLALASLFHSKRSLGALSQRSAALLTSPLPRAFHASMLKSGFGRRRRPTTPVEYGSLA